MRFTTLASVVIAAQAPAIGAFFFQSPEGLEDRVSDLEARLDALNSSVATDDVSFGDDDLSGVGIDPTLTGVIVRDPDGLRIVETDDNTNRRRRRLEDTRPSGPTLLFGKENGCRIQVDPNGPSGLLLRDPSVRILPVDVEKTPLATLLFGQKDDCRIMVDLDPSSETKGLQLVDPEGARLINPNTGLGSTLFFGKTNDCSIGIDIENGAGLIFDDPEGFAFRNGDVLMEANLKVEGTITGDFGGASSRRLKENIETITDAKEKIALLRGVYFDWKKDYGGQAAIGFIAEEVAQVFPQAIIFDKDGTTPKAVRYANLVAVTVEAVKAQQNEITQLQKELQEVKKQMDLYGIARG